MTVPERVVALEGCVNFRDLGGYRTADGRQVAWRRLFRADGLSRLTPDDLAVLSGFGLRTVIDLRSPGEVAQRGRFPVETAGVDYVALPVSDVLPSPETLEGWGEAAYAADRYVEMVEQGGPALAAAIDVLAMGDLPAVYHCSAGKDRTGVLSALVLAFLGVPDPVIVEDYTLSGAAMDDLLERIKAEFPDNVEAVARYAPAVLHVAPESMERFLATMRDRYGTYAGLASELGVADAVEDLAARVLVEA